MGLFDFITQPVAALGGAILGTASRSHGANLAYKGAKETNATNLRIARENRDWQANMANSAHQREIADMRKAGINPVLSLTGGSGAGVPNVPMPAMSNARTHQGKMWDSIGSAMSNNAGKMVAFQNAKSSLEMQKQNVTNARKTGKLIDAQTLLTENKAGAVKPAGDVGNDVSDLYSDAKNFLRRQWLNYEIEHDPDPDAPKPVVRKKVKKKFNKNANPKFSNEGKANKYFKSKRGNNMPKFMKG